MKLLTKEILKRTPKLYETEEVPLEDKVVQAKFFLPSGRWTWFLVEYDPKDNLGFGYVLSGIDPDFDEWGYFSIDELQSLQTPLGLNIERDIHWTPKKFSTINLGIH